MPLILSHNQQTNLSAEYFLLLPLTAIFPPWLLRLFIKHSERGNWELLARAHSLRSHQYSSNRSNLWYLWQAVVYSHLELQFIAPGCSISLTSRWPTWLLPFLFPPFKVVLLFLSASVLLNFSKQMSSLPPLPPPCFFCFFLISLSLFLRSSH